MKQLDKETDGLMCDGYRPGTRNNLSTQARAYFDFCEMFKFEPFPANTQRLNRFVTFLHLVRDMRSDTIANYVSGVRVLHQLMEIEPPEIGYVTKLLMKGVKARDKRPRKQATPIEPDVFLKMLPHVNYKDDLELVAWVALLMGFHLLLRPSNITSVAKHKFDPSINLTRADFRMKNDVMLVHIKWTKTLQYKERKLLIPVIPFANMGISAVKWFQYMIMRIPATPREPAFSVPKKGINLPLTYSQLGRLLKKWIALAQLNPTNFSLHGLRRGGACWLDKHGVPDRVIQVLGDWKTSAFKLYIDSALQTRLQAMTAFAEHY